MYRAIKVDCNHGNETESVVLLGTSINEKAEWMADITQVREGGGREGRREGGRERGRAGGLKEGRKAREGRNDINFNYCSVWRMRSRTRS